MNKSELIQELRKLDEVTLMELLEITSDDLIDAFYDRIEDKIEYLRREIQENF